MREIERENTDSQRDARNCNYVFASSRRKRYNYVQFVNSRQAYS